jgi:hypothetical protein
MELRFDGATKDVFQDFRNDPSGAAGIYKNRNMMLGTSVVVSF